MWIRRYAVRLCLIEGLRGGASVSGDAGLVRAGGSGAAATPHGEAAHGCHVRALPRGGRRHDDSSARLSPRGPAPGPAVSQGGTLARPSRERPACPGGPRVHPAMGLFRHGLFLSDPLSAPSATEGGLLPRRGERIGRTGDPGTHDGLVLARGTFPRRVMSPLTGSSTSFAAAWPADARTGDVAAAMTWEREPHVRPVDCVSCALKGRRATTRA
jgi:hypothetical protein